MLLVEFGGNGGYWFEKVVGCYNSGTISGNTAVGLIYRIDGYIKNSCNFGEINGKSYAVGIVAETEVGGGSNGADISCCLNKGNVISTAGIAYGVADDSWTTLIKPWAAIVTGRVQGKTAVYGIRSGHSYYSSDENGEAYYLAGQLYLDNVQQADTEEARTQEEINEIMGNKDIIDILNSNGNAFKPDTNNINNGLPILNWQ